MDSIKQIWISPYILKEKRSQKEHSGFLLKVLFSKGQVGYNCVHPFPQFGEGVLSDYIPLMRQYRELSQKCFEEKTWKIKSEKKKYLLSVILEDVWMDAKARSTNHSLLFGYSPIQNHYLVPNIHQSPSLDSQPFNMFKVKMGFHLQSETKQLRRIIKNVGQKKSFRLDFNERLSKQEWQKWENENRDIHPYIDFIEDPYLNFSYTPSCFSLAQDWSDSPYCPIRVVKSSRHSLCSVYQQLAEGRFQRVVFTHSLTHPLEARLSWVKALQFYKVHPRKKEICGLNYSLDYYEKNDFSCFYSSSQFYSPLGAGLGFDRLFEKQNWRAL